MLSLRSAWFGILYLSSLIHHVAGCPGLVPGWRSQTWLDKSMRIPYHSPGDSPACVLPWRGESPGERTVEQIFVAHKERHPGTRPGQPQISQIGTAASTLPSWISLCLASHRFSDFCDTFGLESEASFDSAKRGFCIIGAPISRLKKRYSISRWKGHCFRNRRGKTNRSQEDPLQYSLLLLCIVCSRAKTGVILRFWRARSQGVRHTIRRTGNG